MKKLCILFVITILMSGASTVNKAEVYKVQPLITTVKIDPLAERAKILDSLLIELKKETNDKNK